MRADPSRTASEDTAFALCSHCLRGDYDTILLCIFTAFVATTTPFCPAVLATKTPVCLAVPQIVRGDKLLPVGRC